MVEQRDIIKMRDMVGELRDQAKELTCKADRLETIAKGICELDAWVCPGCHWVHAESVRDKLWIPQPEEGIVTCDACDTMFTTEVVIQELKELRMANRCKKAGIPYPGNDYELAEPPCISSGLDECEKWEFGG